MRALLPLVRDQGQRGTCVAFAVTAAHEVARAAGAVVSDDLSEEALFWGCKIIDQNWSSGTRLSSAAAAIGTTGQPLETVWPYVAHRPAGTRYDPPARPSDAWHKSGLRQSSVDPVSIRVELAAGRPVVLGLTVFDTLFAPSAAGRVDMPAAGSPPRGRHAVLAVGYDASGLLIRNSWGATWALDGYGWLSNEYAERHVREAWVIQPRGQGPGTTSLAPSMGDIYEYQ